MKLDDLRRDLSQSAPKKPRVLIPLIFGSIALHSLILLIVARFPAPPAPAPEVLTEVQLDDLPAPPAPAPKIEAARAASPETPRLARAPQPSKTAPVRPAQPARPNVPLPVQIVPTAPLVRSTREVAKTGVRAKKPVAPTPAPVTLAPTPVPLAPRASDTTLPRPQNPTPSAPTPSAPTPSAKTAPLSKTDAKQTGANRGASGRKKAGEQGADLAAKKPGVPLPTAVPAAPNPRPTATSQGPTPLAKKQVDKPLPLPTSLPAAGKNQANEKTNGAGSSARKGSADSQQKSRDLGAGSGSKNKNDGGNGSQNLPIGSGDGPFGSGGGASRNVGEGPRRIVYILDVSYSMGPRLERAKKELSDALGGLQPGESFNIIAFYGNVMPFEKRLVEATPRNIDKGRAFLEALRLKRYTNLERAFETAFAAPGVNVVVLITDGVPTYGLGSPDFSETGTPDIGANFGELVERVRQLNRDGARIYTVGIVGKKPDGTPDRFEAASLLQRIAKDSGGGFVTVRIDAPAQADFSG